MTLAAVSGLPQPRSLGSPHYLMFVIRPGAPYGRVACGADPSRAIRYRHQLAAKPAMGDGGYCTARQGAIDSRSYETPKQFYVIHHLA